MATFYCRHSLNTSHAPFPGRKVEANTHAEAAASYAAVLNLGPNVKIMVVEGVEQWFVTGQVSPTDPPTYA